MPKGVYDRSTSRWVPPPHAVYDPALVERVRELYQDGHTMREVAEMAGTTVKILQRLMPQHGIERRRPVKRNQTGAANSSWKGDEATYAALHLRVVAQRGAPQECSTCGTTSTNAKFEWANLTGRYNDVTDYARMCASCHRKFDAARRRQTGASTTPERFRRRGERNV